MYFDGKVRIERPLREELINDYKIVTYLGSAVLFKRDVPAQIHIRGPFDSSVWNLLRNAEIYSRYKIYDIREDGVMLFTNLSDVYIPLVIQTDIEEVVEVSNNVSMDDF